MSVILTLMSIIRAVCRSLERSLRGWPVLVLVVGHGEPFPHPIRARVVEVHNKNSYKTANRRTTGHTDRPCTWMSVLPTPMSVSGH